MASLPDFAVPGKPLGPTTHYLPGPGTHIYANQIVASQLGRVVLTPAKPGPGPVKRLTKIATLAGLKNDALPTLSIDRGARKHEVLPDVNNIVLCRVTRIMPRQAIVSIQQVGDTVLDTQWQGVIRSQDVRATEKDKVKMYESFKPGDLVRAQVISLGDQANYFLSTASNELGVIMATSEAGNDMVPVSWKEFRDPVAEHTEPRKVAKPD